MAVCLLKMDKLLFVKAEIRDKIQLVTPPEYTVAISLYSHGITESEFRKMKDCLDIPYPVFSKIGNYLREEWNKQ